MPYRRNLIDQFEVIKSLIQSGFTFQESLNLANPDRSLLVPAEFAREWQEIKIQILEGQLSGAQALQSLISRIELDVEVSEAFQKTSAMAVAQSYICGFLFLGALILRVWLSDAPFQVTDGLAFLMIAIAALSQWKIYRHFLRESWFHDWLKFISNFESQIRSGKTPQQALQENRERLNKKIPEYLLDPEKNSEPNRTAKKNIGPLEKSAQKSWNLIWLAHSRGLGLGQFLERQREILLKKLLAHYSIAATRLSLLMLIPLYLLFLPACLMVMLGPLLASLFKI